MLYLRDYLEIFIEGFNPRKVQIRILHKPIISVWHRGQ